MKISNRNIEIDTEGLGDIHDLTAEIREFIRETGCANGLLTVFVPGSTAGVTTIEYESGAIEDLKDAIERIAPAGLRYAHDARWGDGNGFSHVRAALLGPSVSVPVANGEVQLGTWQQVILVDFDNRPRRRRIVMQITGE
jgi:secondary thiamine-phosphate synthase enzyme